MKKLITIILLLSSLVVNAQTTNYPNPIRVFNKTHTKSWLVSSKPGFISDTAILGKPFYGKSPKIRFIKTEDIPYALFEVKAFRSKMPNDIDSLIIHVKKSNLKWINDSTAVFRTKTNQP